MVTNEENTMDFSVVFVTGPELVISHCTYWIELQILRTPRRNQVQWHHWVARELNRLCSLMRLPWLAITWLVTSMMRVQPFSSYRKRHRLEGQHSDTITSLSFCPNGTSLASTGIDGKLCVWSTNSGLATHVVTSKTKVAFLVLLWVDTLMLLAGMENGCLLCLKFSEVWSL